MRLSLQFRLYAVVGAGVALFAIFLICSREPHYHGKPLSHWATELRYGDRREQGEAQEALRAMGTAAVPRLVNILVKEDPPWKLWIWNNYGQKYAVLNRCAWLWPTFDQSRASAASALGEIGPSASNAIPALIRMSQTNNLARNPEWVGPHAAAALMKIKGESPEPLFKAVKDSSRYFQWQQTAVMLGEFGTNARPAVPSLCEALKSTNDSVCEIAASTLGHIHSDPETAVPALIGAIKNVRPGVMTEYLLGNELWALGEFEGDARVATPTIRGFLNDRHETVRQIAFHSLFRIMTPEELKTLIPVLERDAQDRDENVKGSALYLLNQIDPKAAEKWRSKK